jgi:hypothetical protein
MMKRLLIIINVEGLLPVIGSLRTHFAFYARQHHANHVLTHKLAYVLIASVLSLGGLLAGTGEVLVGLRVAR